MVRSRTRDASERNAVKRLSKEEAERHLIGAAIMWWKAKRPVGWRTEKHLQSPTVNVLNAREERLAREAARVYGVSRQPTGELPKGDRE
jgi:hypothetical protein